MLSRWPSHPTNGRIATTAPQDSLRRPRSRPPDTLMSTAIKTPDPEPAHHYIVRRTVEACDMAKEAAGAAAEGIATGSSTLLNSLRQRERELDTLDMEIDSGVTTAITEVGPAEARELLACMKFMIGLERIGDLLLSFANSALSVSGRIDPEDTRDLTQMATILEKMLTDCGAVVFRPRNRQGHRRPPRRRRDGSPAQPHLPAPHRKSGKHAPPGQPASHLHDPVPGARRRSRQESRRRSLPLRQRTHRPPRLSSPTTNPSSRCSSTTFAAASTTADTQK